ncbi:hypothetical protein AGMMS49975_01400 [Clostridia bacterium]|nr:hypothetical protein AGMMS49975_01400 [Clostridia bacterium]
MGLWEELKDELKLKERIKIEYEEEGRRLRKKDAEERARVEQEHLRELEQRRPQIEQELQEQLRKQAEELARVEQEQLQERWRVLEELGQFERVKEEQEQHREQARRKELGLPEESPRLPEPPKQEPQSPLNAAELELRLKEEYEREMQRLEDDKKQAAQHGSPFDRFASFEEQQINEHFKKRLLELRKQQN